jgi:hypothetical protein
LTDTNVESASAPGLAASNPQAALRSYTGDRDASKIHGSAWSQQQAFIGDAPKYGFYWPITAPPPPCHGENIVLMHRCGQCRVGAVPGKQCLGSANGVKARAAPSKLHGHRCFREAWLAERRVSFMNERSSTVVFSCALLRASPDGSRLSDGIGRIFEQFCSNCHGGEFTDPSVGGASMIHEMAMPERTTELRRWDSGFPTESSSSPK